MEPGNPQPLDTPDDQPIEKAKEQPPEESRDKQRELAEGTQGSPDDFQVENNRADSQCDLSTQAVRQLIRIQESFHKGPIPSPSDLAEYDKILPGAADRLIAMAEEQGRHRRRLEEAVVKSDIERASTGLKFAFFLSLVIVCLGSLLIYYDHDWAGGGMIGTTLVSLAGLFITGKVLQKKELARKAREVPPPSSTAAIS